MRLDKASNEQRQQTIYKLTSFLTIKCSKQEIQIHDNIIIIMVFILKEIAIDDLWKLQTKQADNIINCYIKILSIYKFGEFLLLVSYNLLHKPPSNGNTSCVQSTQHIVYHTHSTQWLLSTCF